MNRNFIQLSLVMALVGGCPVFASTKTNCFDSLVAQANAHAQQKDFEAALSEYSQALEMRPGHGGVLYNRARVRFVLMDFHEAQADLARVVDEQLLTGEYLAHVHGLRAEIAVRRLDYDLAVADLDAALELAPGNKKLLERRVEVMEQARKRGMDRPGLLLPANTKPEIPGQLR